MTTGSTLRGFARWAFARSIESLNRLMPKRDHVVVHGFPRTEGNVVEVVRAMALRYRGTIFWLDGPTELSGFGPKVHSVARLSGAGILRYLTAEVVLFTHGLYGDAVPNRGQVIVNLWHGDGPKLNTPASRSGRSPAPATYIVGSTRTFTAKKASDFRMRPADTILSGNPRTDSFFRNEDRSRMRQLGIEPDHPFVIWLPTFRNARLVGALSAFHLPPAEPNVQLNDGMAVGARTLVGAGLQVLLKRHPLDSDRCDVPGVRSIRDEDLEGAGISLYGLIAASWGLITDFSSVSTDYLLLDKPQAFFMPDKCQYLRARGLYPPDFLDWLPGQELADETSFRRFAEDVLGGGRAEAEARRFAIDKLGLVRTEHAADGLLNELEKRHAFRRSGGLRSGGVLLVRGGERPDGHWTRS